MYFVDAYYYSLSIILAIERCRQKRDRNYIDVIAFPIIRLNSYCLYELSPFLEYRRFIRVIKTENLSIHSLLKRPLILINL